MITYRLKEGCGRHTTEEGRLIKAGEKFDSKSDLVTCFPDKFEVVTAIQKTTETDAGEFGSNVTEHFLIHLEDLSGATIWKKGRRYLIVMDETPVNTTPSRLTNGEKVIEAIKVLSEPSPNEEDQEESD